MRTPATALEIKTQLVLSSVIEVSTGKIFRTQAYKSIVIHSRNTTIKSLELLKIAAKATV